MIKSDEKSTIDSWLVIRRVKDAQQCPHCDREITKPEDGIARFSSIEGAQAFVVRELNEGALPHKIKLVPMMRKSK